jgi:hypothetical protein
MVKGMSSLESLIATAGEAPLLDTLDFTLPAANTSVVDRRQHVRAYPTSASTLTPTGTRTCRIRLGGDDFVDASSVRLQYTINNTNATKALVPRTGPWGAWSQVYLRSNGVELDNIPQYGRFHQQYGWNQLSQEHQFGEAGISGLAGSWNANGTPSVGTIAANGSFTVLHKVHVSVFNSGKLLPTRYMPLELELSLNSTVLDWVNPDGTTNSETYSISNIQLLYDAYVLDEAVQESFYKALLASRVLTIPTMTVYQVVQSIPAGSTSYSFSAVRAFTRLSHVWLTFRGTGARSCEFLNPTTRAGNGATPVLADNGCPSVRLSIGPHYWPDPQPNQSIPELFYQLQKSLPNIPNITRDQFSSNTANSGAFTIAFDVRKVPADPTSAISTRSGDLLRVDLLNLTADAVTECYLTLFAFSTTAIRESGVTLMT